MTWPLHTFCREDYKVLIEALLAMGYHFTSLDGVTKGAPAVFCRHDVDISLEFALEMGELENTLGVPATYYFLLSTEMYNLTSADGRRTLSRLAELGHTVALHFDATKYADDRSELERAAAEECALLEAISGNPVSSLSFHRPAKTLIGLEGTFAGRAHTYEPRFFSGVGYISDSNGGWHHGHPMSHDAVQRGEAIQLLTHPVWWMQDEPTNAVQILERLRRQRGESLQRNLAQTVKQYGAWVESQRS